MKNLLLLFGGRSTEHDISCMSAENVLSEIDRDAYTVFPVGITKNGAWIYVPDETDLVLTDGSWEYKGISAALSPDAVKKSLILFKDHGVEEIRIDVAFPVLHGLYGEDGTVQGLFELAGIPYVGSGVLASAAGMDKSMTKLIVDTLGIRQAEYVLLYRDEILQGPEEASIKVEEQLSYPIFVKPACAGSSMGVSKAEDRDSLKRALVNAAKHDQKILCEACINGRELECAVFADRERAFASGVGEINAAADFYDFDAKYYNEESQTDISPVLPEGAEEEIREDALRIFRAIGAYSLSRVDFFLDEKGVVFNEINTLPGFTAISMYPMLFEKQGVSKKELIDRLITTAFTHEEH